MDQVMVLADNKVSFTVAIWRKTSLKATVRFWVLDKSTNNQLPLVMTSPLSGYVTSLGFHDKLAYPADVTLWRTINAPGGHAIMVSFKKLVLDGILNNCVIVYAETVDGVVTTVIHECKTKKVLPTSIYQAVRTLRVKMTASKHAFARGFKMLFSFHSPTQLPDKTSHRLFNCSVDHYSSFRQHLDCNLETECEDGRDEIGDCPFSSVACQGKVASGNKCFFFTSASNSDSTSMGSFASPMFSWKRAEGKCLIRGGTLASFKTRQERDDLLQLWAFSRESPRYVYIGLRYGGTQKPVMYRRMFWWSDNTIAYSAPSPTFRTRTPSVPRERTCALAYVQLEKKLIIEFNDCASETTATHAVCETYVNKMDGGVHLSVRHAGSSGNIHSTQEQITTKVSLHRKRPLVVCPAGHVIHSFLSCDPLSECFDDRHVSTCPVHKSTGRQQPVQEQSQWKRSVAVKMFSCDKDLTTLHYTLVCDFRPDCRDQSDEMFCWHPPCDGFNCSNGQCVANNSRCDGTVQCRDESDEQGCPKPILPQSVPKKELLRERGAGTVVKLTGTGKCTYSSLSHNESCPDTHYTCPGELSLCLPVYTRCNGYYDCVNRQDEHGCHNVTCPGFYRCRGSSVCVHVDHLCDGWPQCPQHDDEWLCQEAECPADCVCQGLAFVCRRFFPVGLFLQLRYLDVTATPVILSYLAYNVYLIYLSVTKCDISFLPALNLPNLQVLDLSENNLTAVNVGVLLKLSHLKALRLANNPLVSLKMKNTDRIQALEVLDLSRTMLERWDEGFTFSFHRVSHLNLSFTPVAVIGKPGFQGLSQLSVVDMRGCPVQDFPLGLFNGLTQLSVVFASNYRLCCKTVLPVESTSPVCTAPADILSSCQNLLQSKIYQVIMWVVGALSVCGNAASIVARYTVYKEPLDGCCFTLLVTQLSLANLVMGARACLILAANEWYDGEYVTSENVWKESTTCMMGGFLFYLSSQVSAFMVLLVTLDCFIALRCSPRLRMNVTSCLAASVLVWLTGVMVALVPLLPGASHWNFYSHTGLCIPFPATPSNFPGHYYNFALHAVLSGAVCFIIVCCQTSVFVLIHRDRHTLYSTLNVRCADDRLSAFRFLNVAVLNAVCLAVVSTFNLLAKAGGVSVVDSDFNTFLAVVVLPLPAVLNPLLYILNRQAEDRRRKVEEKLMKMLQSKAKSRERIVGNIAALRN